MKEQFLRQPHTCPACKQKMTELVRFLDDGKTPTYNTAFICENPQCPLYINYRKVRNWEKRGLVVYPDSPDRLGYIPNDKMLASRYQKQIEKTKINE